MNYRAYGRLKLPVRLKAELQHYWLLLQTLLPISEPFPYVISVILYLLLNKLSSASWVSHKSHAV